MPPNKSILQHQLLDLVRFTEKYSMVLNTKNRKVWPFISSKKRDFLPQISIEPGKCLEVIYQLKLVGVMITSDLTWQAHVDYTVKRVNGKLWQLARFRRLGATAVHQSLSKFLTAQDTHISPTSTKQSRTLSSHGNLIYLQSQSTMQE